VERRDKKSMGYERHVKKYFTSSIILDSIGGHLRSGGGAVGYARFFAVFSSCFRIEFFFFSKITLKKNNNNNLKKKLGRPGSTYLANK
jgi:hypothetical protein